MIVITRYSVSAEDSDDFVARASGALDALGRRPGYQSGSIARAADEPGTWTVVTEWEGPGSYRRALSDYDVKIAAVPLLSLARDEPSAFEVIARHRPEDR